MKGTYLGEFEEVVLLTVGVLGQDAYGNSVKHEVEERTKRTLNLSAIHSALYRLERKGFLESELGEATKQRGGKRKKYFKVTSYGQRSLSETRDLREGLWKSYQTMNIQTN